MRFLVCWGRGRGFSGVLSETLCGWQSVLSQLVSHWRADRIMQYMGMVTGTALTFTDIASSFLDSFIGIQASIYILDRDANRSKLYYKTVARLVGSFLEFYLITAFWIICRVALPRVQMLDCLMMASSNCIQSMLDIWTPRNQYSTLLVFHAAAAKRRATGVVFV